jgi:hypothetical protein
MNKLQFTLEDAKEERRKQQDQFEALQSIAVKMAADQAARRSFMEGVEFAEANLNATDKPARGLKQALKDLLCYAERQMCTHENTYRSGAMWEICGDCGAKWADDEGGKPPFKWPEVIETARAALADPEGSANRPLNSIKPT